MKTRLLTVALVCAAIIPAWAGKIVTDSIESKTLGATVKYNVYLPSGYDASSKKYPVVYLLHGLWGCYEDWNKLGSMRMVADELMGTGEADEMIIVMPNAGDEDVHTVWNGYFNMPGWNYEDFFFTEFIPGVETKYHGMGDKRYRAIMGLSMGGGGSTVYCQHHPHMFSSCYAMSAWLRQDKVGEANHKDKLYYTRLSVKENSAVKFVQDATEQQALQLRTVKWCFDCGDDDKHFEESVDIHKAMRDKNIKSELRINNGVHNWEYWHQALRRALPFATQHFGK